ncbi:MAG TPA: hypothetical protein VEZ48_08425 [Sphingomonadaceae bacterium]|nr:hypothetical protein [Sphingomonadaceae bacterium]
MTSLAFEPDDRRLFVTTYGRLLVLADPLSWLRTADESGGAR